MELLHFSKEDCGIEMTLEESRKVQLDMLDALADFCDHNGLRYFLSGGTLLGAIRHKGFIPWDDDVDVNMPRPDCEKLMQLTGGQLGRYKVTGPDLDGFSKCCAYYRIYDFNTVIENFIGGATKTHPNYIPIFIDVFPIDGMPDGQRKTKMRFIRIAALRKMYRSSALENMVAKGLAGHIFHVVSAIPARLVGYKNWGKAIQKTASKYAFDEQKYVGVMTVASHTMVERVLKEDYLKKTDVQFEGKYYHAPGNYDTYLSQLYGDYMQMPPEEKRRSHHAFNLYWRKQETSDIS